MYKPAIFYPQTMEEICDVLRGSTKQNYPDKRQGSLPSSSLMSESTFFLLSPKSFSSRTCLQVWRVDWANCYVIFSDFLSDESRMENNIWKWTTHDFRQTSVNSRQYSEYIFIVTSTRASFAIYAWHFLAQENRWIDCWSRFSLFLLSNRASGKILRQEIVLIILQR